MPDRLHRFAHPFERHGAEVSLGEGQKHRDLLDHGEHGELILLEPLPNPLALLDGGAARVVEAGAEPREAFKLLELRIGQLEAPRRLAICGELRLSANARDRAANIDCRKDAKLEERRREINLPVGDGDEVCRDVGRDVLRLRLDDGQGRQRSASLRLFEMRGAFEQARMDEEDVARKGFAAWRTLEQQRQFTVRPCVVGQVIVDDEHVAPPRHEAFSDARRRVGGDVLQTRGIVAFGHDHDAVLHRAPAPKLRDHLGHRGGFLTDCAVDAEHPFAALVEDR